MHKNKTSQTGQICRIDYRLARADCDVSPTQWYPELAAGDRELALSLEGLGLHTTLVTGWGPPRGSALHLLHAGESGGVRRRSRGVRRRSRGVRRRSRRGRSTRTGSARRRTRWRRRTRSLRRAYRRTAFRSWFRTTFSPLLSLSSLPLLISSLFSSLLQATCQGPGG